MGDSILDPTLHYRGGYLKANKKDIHDFTASRFDQMFFKEEQSLVNSANDFSNGLFSAMGLQKARSRDFFLDKVNPKDKLMIDTDPADTIDTIKDFGYTEMALFHDADKKAHTQVKLVQDSLLNASRQAARYDDPQLFFDDSYNGELTGQEPRGTNLKEGGKGLKKDHLKMDGSAAGRWSNFLSEDNYRDNSVESMVAF